MKVALRVMPAALLAILVLVLPAEARQSIEIETHRVAGLARPAEILVDQWGVPHIYARSQDDAIFAQGFNAARDRLFQIDLWRRRGLGQLAEVLGPSYVAQDEATRLFLYRGDMQREWRSYGTEAERIARAFTAGINAYVDFLQTHPERMPFEFRTLGYVPAKWQPEDVVRVRSHGLSRNHLGNVFKKAVLSPAAAAAMDAPDVAVVLDALEKPDALFGADAVARRNAVLLESLAGAYAELEKLQGLEPSQWQWGRLHHTLMEHPLAAAMGEAGRAPLNVGPLPRRGGAYTPNQSTYRASDFRQTNGPSFRVVVDVGDWDNSRAVNAPGQSGNPDSPHYRDLASMWLKGDYFPLLYSHSKVLQATRQRIRLQPLN